MRLQLLLALLALAPLLARAECECVWQGPFTEVQQSTDLVVSATVTGIRGNSVDLKIDRILRGTEYMEDIRLWLNTEGLCRPDPGEFTTNTQWVMALDRIEEVAPGGFNPHTPDISYGRRGDYSISSCGGYWLSRTEDLVTGNLASGTRWDHAPKMSPVLLDLVADHVAGKLDAEALKEASKVDPELQRLRLETRSFLRQQR